MVGAVVGLVGAAQPTAASANVQTELRHKRMDDLRCVTVSSLSAPLTGLAGARAVPRADRAVLQGFQRDARGWRAQKGIWNLEFGIWNACSITNSEHRIRTSVTAAYACLQAVPPFWP